MIRSLMLAASLLATPLAAQTAAPPASTDQALADDIAAKLLPNGTYQRVMGGAVSKMMEGMSGQITSLPLAPFLSAAGLPQSETAKLGQTTIKQIMDIIDPAYQQRMQLITPAVMAGIAQVMTQFEPQMRVGIAHAYANRFTSVQLGEIDRFLNTPSGTAFAAEIMTVASDPVVIRSMQPLRPTLFQALPGIMQKAQASAAGLPKPKTLRTLSDADRTKLAQLLGCPPEKLRAVPAS